MSEDAEPYSRKQSNLTGGRKPPRTTCKVCWCSVFESDETEWVTAPSPGIAHKECAEQKE